MLLRAFTVVSLACLPAALLGQARFEGAITARMQAGQGGTDVTYLIRGDQVRMDVSGRSGATFILHDAAKNTTFMVLPAQRMYMDMSSVSADDAVTRAEQKAGSANVQMTGKKETVAGVECEHVLITGDDGQYDACVAKGMGAFPSMRNSMGARGAAAPAWTQKLGRDAFPLKVQKVGGQLAFEVTKIDRKPLDASLFAIPDGFQTYGAGRVGRPPL